MQRRNVRVIIASEYPRVRNFLREMVEEEPKAVIVGQAENATRALTVARSLRPDVALIDCYLPYTVGLEAVPLSRMSGLDTAQTISEEIPNVRVVLLNNLDGAVLVEDGEGTGISALLSRESPGANIPFTLQELYQELLPANVPVFANIQVERRDDLRQKVDNLSNRAILFGGLGALGGLCLMLTVVLAGAGVFLAAAGAVTVFLGLAGKLAASLCSKWSSRDRLLPERKNMVKGKVK